MNNKLLWLLIFIALSVMACASTELHPGHSTEIKALMQNAKTAADHEALAAHFEEEAQIYKSKAADHMKLLNQYEREPWMFGKQAAGLNYIEHCKLLIQLENQTAQEDLEMAKIHRAIADEMRRQGAPK